MDWRDFGVSGLRVPALGLGAGQIGDPALDESLVARLLHAALDLDIKLIDTARGYGLSEARIGRHLRDRRSQYLLSTKVGYGIDGVADWTYEAVVSGVNEALSRLQTDYLDIVHLHSCPSSVLQQSEVIEGLEACMRQGKVRVLAYSGENEDLRHALFSRRFGSLMTSINLCDQRFIDQGLFDAKELGLGIIAKRPLANAPWRHPDLPSGQYVEEYWKRFRQMALPELRPWSELALRFAAYTYGVDCCIVGSLSPENLQQNVMAIEQGPLPEAWVQQLRQAFRRCDNHWLGQL